jgi:cbb3-type cytochrome oxidase subunit 3
MYKDVLRAIDGIWFYPVVSLVIFVLFFTTVFLWVFRMRKSEAIELAAMPLDDGTPSSSPSTGEHAHG